MRGRRARGLGGWRLVAAGAAWAIACGAPAPAQAPSRVAPSPSQPSPSGAPTQSVGAVERLRADARKLEPLVGAPFTRQFLGATSALPHVAPRTLYRDEEKTRYFTAREHAALGEDARRGLVRDVAGEGVYYETKYGSPLSYARALDVLAENGVTLRAGARLMDFGFGYVGHLRLMASLGMDTVGVDVDPMLRALYAEPGDQGTIAGTQGASGGRVRLVIGKFPASRDVRTVVGGGFDVVLSKNTLKRGYIHPERPADPKKLIDLGATDADVLAAFHDALVPGGTMLVYNICPAPTPPDKPFVPWSDGRSPFSKEQWKAAGFDVLIFDRDDTATLRTFARALGWGDDPEEPWDLDRDLSVIYTLARRAR